MLRRWRPRAGSSSATLAGEGEPVVEQRVVVDDPVREPPLDRLLRVEEPAREDQLGGPTLADHAGQQREHAAAAHLPEVEVAVADAGRRRDQGEVAVEHQLEPAGGGDPVDQRDDRHPQRAEPTEHAVEVGDELREAPPGRFCSLRVALEVAAGAERPAVAR